MTKPVITIAEIRAKYKLNQEEFGKSIGVSKQTVSSWEQDVYRIKSRNLLKIYEVYGVSSSDLLGG
ncbi:helix-turn-helix transcriptional regulator [Streptococcus agalactiae]|uniref:XRE family transcriptional regulator n=2 Tax=Streptococcus agalactiae TaxID=1311 RepID=A0AB74H6Y5_STRAG|nr:helix-turn-helix transcriptional regulator [Streptococcus agalactiae]EPT44228.1 cro regulatory protein [Streptococcus agalactiae FSL S3-501]EPV88126.1 cro regulatory protein [Streptococcus agalactiae FSL S3-251]EPV89946.1 cro regulatory protein [Streptococcus agalactiae FSL S3-105]EPW98467.1 cro regulatory protein [Streptococcus agalactiae MRI Z1-048]KAF1103444.1 transcriptional regulator [Streptococcus agalactiae]